MACTIAVKLHCWNLEQVKETPEPREKEDRSTIFAIGARAHVGSPPVKHGEREKEREKEKGDLIRTCTHAGDIPPTGPLPSFLGIIFILSRKVIVWLGPPGSAPSSMNGVR